MRTADQVLWDFVRQWLDKADHDLRVAELLTEAPLDNFEAVGFHAQQAAEKLIKAFLVRYQIEFPKSHDIARLRGLVAGVDPRLAEELAFADWLTPYGVEFRYPGELAPVGRGQGEELLRLAERSRDLILASLEAYLEAGRPVPIDPTE